MPLHRDIHWIGRQWAVTGIGMQLIDQKLKGFFDIEISQLWDDALVEATRAKEWLNVADFDKGLDVARKRFRDRRPAAPQPEPILPAPPPVAQPVALDVPVASAPSIVPVEPLCEAAPPMRVAKPAEPTPQAPEMIEPPISAPREFEMRFSGYAKFIRPWRVRARKER
jgi:hypothetical protein